MVDTAIEGTKYLWVEGECKWAKLYEHNMDEKFEKFCVNMKINKEVQKKLKDMGFRKRFWEEEGDVWTEFARKAKIVTAKGSMDIGPPPVFEKDGKTLFNKIIGNGSKIAVLLEIYPSKLGTGSRIREVRVIDHVVYVPAPRDDIPEFVPAE